MFVRTIAASLLVPAVLAPLAASAQDGRGLSSAAESFHLVELSVDAARVAPDEFMTKTEAIRSCSDAAALRDAIGADMTRNRFVRATRLPPPLKAMVEQLPVGHATAVYTDDGAVLRVLVLCNRT